MPSIASHYVVASIVSDKLNIKNDDYFLGNILPDITSTNNSHYKIKGKYYLVPNIEEFIKNNKYKKDIFLGYLTHLLLDKYFLELFIPENIKNFDKIPLFTEKLIYNDYTSINYNLVNKYNLNCEYITKIIKKCKYSKNKEKEIINIQSINNKKVGKSIYIDLDKYYIFLEEISKRIACDIKRWC